jgi:predicted hydrolase (HD superfamily)
MTTLHPETTLRETVDELGERLARIGASAAVLRSLAPDIRHDVPPRALVALLHDLDRDLVLASHELEALRERAALELSSIRNRPAQ